MKITRPSKEEYPEYYDRYISKVNDDNIIKGLEEHGKRVLKLISGLGKKQLSYRYEEGKWSIKEILVHMMDGERVFCYRALRFARNDQTELPGFEEKEWAPNSGADDRKIKSILKEYAAVRKASLELFSNMTEEMLNRTGVANGSQFVVRAFPYIILGHEKHHIGIMKERYLG